MTKAGASARSTRGTRTGTTIGATLAAAITTASALGSSVGCGGASADGAGYVQSARDSKTASTRAGTRKTRTAPLVITMVIDQLAAWEVDERLSALPSTGGFARLLREGTRVRSLVYSHAVTDTAPGHAALYTGAIPRDSGITANERVEEAESETPGRRISVLRSALRAPAPDAGAKEKEPTSEVETFAASGKHIVGGSSPWQILPDGLSDRLRDAEPTARIVSISLKDRGSIIPAGRHADAAIWFEPAEDSWVTSSAYTDHFPKWATALGEPNAMAARRTHPWTPLDPEWLAAHAETPAGQPGQGDYGGLGASFPHDLANVKTPAGAFRATPFADDATFDLALAALDHFALGKGESSLDDDRDDDIDPADRPMLLALSFSANDYIGHVFGPHSQEAWDELLRLDASLARFFTALDQRFGADKWSLVLSADHGAGLLPETANVPRVRPFCASTTAAAPAPADRWERPCGALGRILPDVLAAELEAVAKKALGASPKHGSWVAGVADPYIAYGAEARDLDPTKRAALTKALLDALAARSDVARAYDVRALPSHCPADTDASVDALVCRSYAPGRGGDLYVVPRPGFFFDPSVVVGKGESHGTPYLYDRTVPLLVRAPGRVPAGRLVETLPFGSFSRTAASLLGISPPAAATNAPDLTVFPAPAAR